MLVAASIVVVTANLTAFLVYGFDKRQATGGGWRVSEGALFLWAIAGGVGAWIGCEVYRHKTRKQSFRRWLIVAVILHLALIFAGVALLP